MSRNRSIAVLRRSLVGTAVAAALAAPLAAGAQDAPGQRLVLEEITVTAQRREQTLQNVPIAVSAIGAEEISRSLAQNIQNLEGISPNIVIDRVQATPGGAALSIRGISFQDVEKSFDPAVGVVIDGVFMGTNTGQFLQIFDVERIEVLRGPQGTLFGKNTIGGVVNVIRADPTGEFDGKFRAGVGNYGARNFDALVNFPIIDDVLAGKLTYTKRDDDGWYRNAFEDFRRRGGLDYQHIGLMLLYTPNEDIRVRYSFSREDDKSDAAPLINVSGPGDLFCIVFGQCAQNGNIPATGDRRVVNQDGSFDSFIELDAHVLDIGWQVDERWRLDYILGHRRSKESMPQDFDASPLPLFEVRRDQNYKQTSHELRVTYGDERLNVVAGAYYWDAEFQLGQRTFHFFDVLQQLGVFPEIVPGQNPVVQLQATDHKTESWAVFFQADWEFVPDWTLTLGGRYTDEKKRMARAQAFDLRGIPNIAVSQGLVPSPPFSDTFIQGSGVYPVPLGIVLPDFSTFDDRPSRSWSEFSPKIGLSWQATPDAMVYASYTSGFRSGGYNGRAGTLGTALVAFDPETVDNYELGAKTRWLDNMLQINAAVFRMDYKDKQEEVVRRTPTGDQETVVANASTARYDGVELELLAMPLDGLTLRATFGYLDSGFRSFIADLDGDGVETDNSDLELRRAPKYTYSLGANYAWQMGPGTASVNASWRYKDKYWTTFQNQPPRGLAEAHGILDASLSYELDQWRFSVFGRNLNNATAENSTLLVAGLFAFATTIPDRTYGAEVLWRFGSN